MVAETTLSHFPVMIREVVDALHPISGGVYLDCTFGQGGHSRALLEKCRDIVIVAVDRDPSTRAAFRQLQEDFPQSTLKLRTQSFGEASRQLHDTSATFDGILADLG